MSEGNADQSDGPLHVAAFIKDLQSRFSPPTVKQHLAALRMLFDWLVTGHVIEMNPAHAVRGPKYVVKRGKTPVLASDEARQLLDSINITTLKGLRDRALIGLMAIKFYDHRADEISLDEIEKISI